MRILGVETSCDETAFAIVEDGVRVRASVIASQDELHTKYGGVVPEIASRAHVERLIPTLRAACAEADVGLEAVDAVAVGNRPGLIGSLLVGVPAAKAIAWALDVPIVGVDHIHAHLYAPALDAETIDYPALGLVISGGHTTLFHCDSPIDLQAIGATIDDAVGEAYDKVATMLGLAYPGGPKLDALAQRGDAGAHAFPVSQLNDAPLDFSYSGLKTACLYAIKGTPVRDRETRKTHFSRDAGDLTGKERADIAASFQRAAVAQLVNRVERALTGNSAPCRDGCASGPSNDHRSLIIGGGVSANSFVRSEFARVATARNIPLRLASMRHFTDNAAMIAGLAFHKLRAGRTDDLSLTAAPTSRA